MYQDVLIRKVNLGWVITVGCQTFAFTDYKKMIKAVGAYFTDPEAARIKYVDGQCQMLQPEAPVAYANPTLVQTRTEQPNSGVADSSPDGAS